MGFWSGIKDMAKRLAVLTFVIGGPIMVYLKNEENQAGKRDKEPVLTKSEERMIANKGRSVDPYTENGAITGVLRLAERHKWTPSQGDNAISGTGVVIETADGAQKGMAAHPKKSPQDVSKKRYNPDTLLEIEGATDVRIPSSPTNGNTLLPNEVVRINEGKTIRISGAPKPEGVATTLSKNGNQVVYRGKTVQKKASTPDKAAKVVKSSKDVKAVIKTAANQAGAKPAVYNSRREKGYTQAGVVSIRQKPTQSR